MRSILIISLIIGTIFTSIGQTSVKVRRGDTWKSIASQFGVDPNELMIANGNIPECYIGMEVKVPAELLEKATLQREAMLKEAREKELQSLYGQAEALEEQGDFKGAKKIYDKILEHDRSAWAYYSRGWVQYKRGKWSDAISDLNYASGLSDATEEIRSSAKALSRDAQERKDIADAKRSELIGNILGMTVATAGVVVGAVMIDKATKGNLSTASGISPSKIVGSPKQVSSTGDSNKLSYRQQYDKYLSPEAFVYNYTHGLPTLPSASEMGLSGIDAYGYDLQRNLQEQSIAMDRRASIDTYRLVEEGNQRAQKEISEFSAIYGRSPSESEINAIYKKHTQGYIDSYSDYVKENVSTSKSLGLSDIDRTSFDRKSNGDNAGSNEHKEKSFGETYVPVKNAEKRSTAMGNEAAAKKNDAKEDKIEDEHPYYGRYIQRRVNVYDYATETVSFSGAKVYQKGPVYYLNIRGDYYKVSKTNKPKFGYKIMHGSKEYYFNM